MAEEEAAHHLLNVLEERNLNVDLDKILAAFEDEDSKKEVAAWVNEYLQEETLLSKEELELYQMLKNKRLLHQYETEHESIRPILDHELAFAIDSLQSSTAAIEEQCKVLEKQKEALMALKALDKPNLEVEHLRNERRRKENQEKGRLDVAVGDVSTIVKDQLTDTQRDIDADKSALKSYLAERLASDDQILSRLPNIVSQIVAEPEVSEDEKSIEQWCKAIIAYRTAEVKARVDTVYLNSLSNYSPEDLPQAPEGELEEQKAALQAELEDLHSEIASVTEMVVEHELRKPMVEIKERKEKERTQARGAWLRYVLSTLEYMGKRLDTVTSHTKNLDEYQQALAHISDAASKRMPNTQPSASTPPRRRAQSAPKSAFSPAVKLKPAKPLHLPPALQDALRHAGVSSNEDSIEALQQTLAKTTLERQRKLQEHQETTTLSTHEKVAEQMSKTDVDIRAVLSALYAHTPFQQVSLMDPEIEEQIEDMEKELEKADQELMKAEASEMSLSDPRVRAFVAKYGK